MSTRRIFTPLVLAAFLVVTAVTATGASADGRRAPARVTTTVRGIITHWSPTIVRVSKGATIKWRSVTGSHTVTAYGTNWTFNRNLPSGAVTRRIFRRAGTFRFRCTIHSTLTNGQCSGMCGKVIVRR
jgi:plastocyanin